MARAVEIGYSQKVEKVKDNLGNDVWYWEAKHFRRQLGRGVADSEKAARDASWATVRENMENKKESTASRGRYKMKLNAFAEKRPYLTLAVCNFVLGGEGKVSVMRNAKEQEQFWWDMDKAKTKKPLPTHHSSLDPMTASERIFDAMVGSELIVLGENGVPVKVGKLRTWAIDMFGEVVFGDANLLNKRGVGENE